MLYRKVPQNDDRLSILGFGCMRLPVRDDNSIDEERAIAQIRSGIDSGINYLDTAWPYHDGNGEVVLGKALKNGYRQKVKIATKLPSWLIKNREDMDFYLARQLEKLQSDHIDYYLLHALNKKSWNSLLSLGVTDFLQQAIADGRIINPGFSFHGLAEDFTMIVDAFPWIFCQIQYNFLDRENQAGLAGLQYAAAKDLAVIIMEPLRGGNLGLAQAPPAIQKLWDSGGGGRTPAEWALRWVWNHPEVTSVLSGMNLEDHITENLRVAETGFANSLRLEELALVDRVAEMYQELMKVGCTGCGYCMPCPEGVKIPSVFEVYNKMHMFGEEQKAKITYALRLSGTITAETPGFASQCVKCGQCEKKCPQRIEIMSTLAEVAEVMEDSGLERRIAVAAKILNGG
ncbi:aldo/keto reductase [Desulforhopalus singaporensis]|uniref:4Fe-4S ferredoxin-type domain-containing protein n=1 Tax=Desulforhopalus singaporensis TaxID=91360 RepID=A0A1H0TCG3_9BACT|nr:aldo/keto reductase [Desulforhopalus singaporensis]SDP51545.1 hypothetical protein SAMN05660330_03015 [Desulforhopalus singaporensis]